MDELWQRYRSFWTPVLIGLGVFLVGLIAVHVLTDDPDAWQRRVRTASDDVKRRVEPSSRQVRAARDNRDHFEARVRDWAKRLDQAALKDPLEDVVGAALQAAVLRGQTPEALGVAVAAPESPSSRQVLAVFEGDDVAASKALARYEEVRQDRLNLLRTGDPNVGFSRLLNDVWSELRVRANRADVELGTDVLGFGGVTSVTRPVLAQRLLNLARVSQIIDLSIRSGVRAVTEVRLEQKINPLGDDVFLREWPFTVTVRGDMAAMRPLVSYFTDPERPVPLSHFVLSQPPRSSPLEGQVQLQARAASVLVRPDAELLLDMEEAR